jgi:hypothetical protein
MPFDRSRYPVNWREISRAVRDRSGGICEAHLVIADYPRLAPCQARNGEPHPITGSRVVLTVAHRWRGPCAECDGLGVKCGNPDHLAALCQRCHLAYDLEHHIRNRRVNRHARRAVADLFPEAR